MSGYGVHHSEFAQCFDCGRSMTGILDSHLRLYCDECVERLGMKNTQEYLNSVSLIALTPPANR